MRLVFVTADNPHEWNSSEWRCAVPARAINRSGLATATLIDLREWLVGTTAAQAACRSADVIVIQRNLIGPVLSAIMHWKSRGKTIIADFDDAYDQMPDSNPAYAFWHKGWVRQPDGRYETLTPPPIEQFVWGLKLCHAATMPSQRLADDWVHLLPTYCVPNALDPAIYRLEEGGAPPPAPAAGERIRIGWGGSLSHMQSFTDSGVLTALQRVCRARPEVEIVIHGNDGRLIEALKVSPEQKRLQPWVPYREWPAQLCALDLGLAPLCGSYDERRSWIKGLEYLAVGLPWIASDGPVYAGLRTYATLVENTVFAWERSILDHLDTLGERQLLARANRAQAARYTADAQVPEMLRVYASIHQHAQAASAALVERTPV